jgi:sulfur relay (sulfurtransferase) DsrF/TusC family protein
VNALAESIVVIIGKAPYGNENVYGAFYTAVASLELNLKVTIILIDDGVYAAIKAQKPEAIGYPSLEDLASRLYPECTLLVDTNSLTERGIVKDSLVKSAKLVEQEEFLETICQEGQAILVY